MSDRFSFRWLGVQGLELSCEGQTLAIDPFFTRPPLRTLLLRRVRPDPSLSARLLERCQNILVTHPHYDHVMDVPDLARKSEAQVFGSANTGQILALSGIPVRQFHLIKPGDQLSLEPFEVEVFANSHVALPIDPLINGPLRPGLRLPLRLVDYRMDCSFGFSIRVQGVRILFCPGPALPADLLFAGVWRGLAEYRSLLAAVHPQVYLPVHWDNFFRPIDQPVRELVRPGGLSLARLQHFVQETSPATKFCVPQLLKWVDVGELLSD
jgi:L-ascorbate metabolism protein UlaG (beta-lactamase superfamily)